jgi:hypothetical protein
METTKIRSARRGAKRGRTRAKTRAKTRWKKPGRGYDFLFRSYESGKEARV